MLSIIANSTVSQTVDNTAAVLTASANKTAAGLAKVTVYSQPIRYTLDGITPTATLGHYATDKDVIILVNQTEIAGFRAIREGGSNATIIVSYCAGNASDAELQLLADGLR